MWVLEQFHLLHLQISDVSAEGPTFKLDGLSPSILFQDNSGVSNTVDNFEIKKIT